MSDGAGAPLLRLDNAGHRHSVIMLTPAPWPRERGRRGPPTVCVHVSRLDQRYSQPGPPENSPRSASSSAAGDLRRVGGDPVLGRYLGWRAAATRHFRAVRRRASVRHSVPRGTARCLRACPRHVAIMIGGFARQPASPPDAGYHIRHDTAGHSNCLWLSMKRRLPALDPIRTLTRYNHCD